MPVRLVSLDGLEDIPLDRALILVGRDPGCDVQIESSRVSRHQCCLRLGLGEVLVIDLGSTNGTRINGQRIREGLLRQGDELSVAHARYRLVVDVVDEGCVKAEPSSLVSGPTEL